MRLLLDTHTFVWWTLDSPRLSISGRNAIENAEVVSVSLVTAWEIAIKVGQGKWPEANLVLETFEAITVPHVRAAGLMQSPHRDPFDRLLAAQALAAGLTLVTADPMVQALGSACLW